MLKRKIPDISFTLSYDTACALQSILTQQMVHSKTAGSPALESEFEQANRFYERLTDYVTRK